jgi:hypothetical protein
VAWDGGAVVVVVGGAGAVTFVTTVRAAWLVAEFRVAPACSVKSTLEALPALMSAMPASVSAVAGHRAILATDREIGEGGRLL